MKKKLKRKIYTEPLNNFCNLEWLTLENCPMYDHPEYGPVIDLTAKEMETLAAVQIVKSMVPLRGLEISILRGALGFSYEEFARSFGLSAATVFKWERAKREYVSLPNDLMIRMHAAEKFKCKIPSKFSELSRRETPEKPIVFQIAA